VHQLGLPTHRVPQRTAIGLEGWRGIEDSRPQRPAPATLRLADEGNKGRNCPEDVPTPVPVSPSIRSFERGLLMGPELGNWGLRVRCHRRQQRPSRRILQVVPASVHRWWDEETGIREAMAMVQIADGSPCRNDKESLARPSLPRARGAFPRATTATRVEGCRLAKIGGVLLEQNPHWREARRQRLGLQHRDSSVTRLDRLVLALPTRGTRWVRSGFWRFGLSGVGTPEEESDLAPHAAHRVGSSTSCSGLFAAAWHPHVWFTTTASCVSVALPSRRPRGTRSSW
jgi:hypothetical protein